MSTPSTDQALVAAPGGLVASPSVMPSIDEQVHTTFATLDRSAGRVVEQATRISDTLGALDEALSHVAGASGGGSQEWGGFGLVSLPIVGALRAARALAGQYVKQQTGSSLTSWTDFVESSATLFDGYLAELAAIRSTIERYRRSGAGPLDIDRTSDDVRQLTEARWRTAAWKVVLTRVAQLGQVVEAIFATDLGALDVPEPGASAADPPGLAGSLQRRFKEVQSRTLDRTSDMREWVLRPFVDVRDRIKELPAQVERLSREVALFEVLLELEVAALRAALGQVPAEEVRVLGLRISAGVVIPDLADRLGATRAEVAAHEAWLTALDDHTRSGQVAPDVAGVLRSQYREGLAAGAERLAELERQAEVWRRSGPAMIADCSAWVRRELDILAAREAVEGPGVDLSRRPLLLRERERLTEAQALVAAL